MSKEQETIKQLNAKLAESLKVINLLNKGAKDSTKAFKDMKKGAGEVGDSFEDQEKKIDSLVGKFKTLQDNIVNVDQKYDNLADRMIKPLNVEMIGGTLAIGASVIAAHDLVQELSGIADSFSDMSSSSGSAGEAMGTMFDAMGTSLAGKGVIQGAMHSLNNIGLELGSTFTKLTAEVGTLGQITGVAADSWAGFHGEMMRGFGATLDDIDNLSSALIGTGLKGAQLESVMTTVKTTIEQVGFVAKDGVKSIKALTQSMGASISVFSKMGISAQKAGEFIGSMMNPEDFGKNASMIANLGISYEDYAASLESAEGKTKLLNKAMENLPQLASRISEIRDPFQRMNLAKSLGVPMEIVSKMAGKTKSEIQEMMKVQMQESAGKEALEKKKSEAKANQEKFTDALWLLKMKMLGPVMDFVSKNYGNFFKVLDSNSASIARAFQALFGVIGKLIPLLVKVSVFIGQNIAKAFEIVVKPVGKLVDLLLKLVFPIFNNIVIPVVEKFAKGVEWLADHLTNIIPVLIPFVAAIGGFILLKKGISVIQGLNAALNNTFTTAKKAAIQLAKGNVKGAMDALNPKGTDAGVTKTKLDNWKELAKGIFTPIVKKLDKLKNFVTDGNKSSLRDQINKRKSAKGISIEKPNLPEVKNLSFSGKRDLELGKIQLAQSNKLKELAKLQSMPFAEKRKMALVKSGAEVITKAPDLSKAGDLIASGITKSFGKGAFGAITKTIGGLGKFATALPGIGLAIAATTGAVSGFVNSEKFFGKELTESQEEQLSKLEALKASGEKLNDDEISQLEKLRSIKAKMMTQEEKELLIDLKRKKDIGTLSESESKQLESLLAKELAGTATWGEKIASTLAGGLTLGILPLIDSFFGTELTKSFAQALLPIGNWISSFISSLKPIWKAFVFGWNNLVTDLMWVWARIQAIWEIYVTQPLDTLWASFKNFGSSILNLFGGFDSVGEGFTNTMKGVGEGLKTLGSIFRKIFNVWFKATLLPIMSLFDAMGSMFKSFIGSITSVIDNFSKMINFFKSGEIWEGIKAGLSALGGMILAPFKALAASITGLFSRVGRMISGIWDKLIISMANQGGIIGQLASTMSGKSVEELKEKGKKNENTDKWTQTFDDFADKFGQAQSRAEKQNVLNSLANSKSFENLMGANSSLDEETKLTYKNMLEMMKKQLAETKDAKKEAIKTGGGIKGAIEKKEPPPEIKPEIKLRSFGLLRFAGL
jgi:hypothetical protein